ncbi:PaaI family thioesterase [Aquabacterium humicola]|uniref:PaaI family thioesterase n=1 Tax=Aquabacterium humicola TaxID=3237377 RepID=UPI002543D5D1|nr:PaaI family thioesterase [Rubrivivax pictus]
MRLPFVEHVGAEIADVRDGASLLTLVIAPLHLNSSGVVHGGVLFTLADTGMGAALFSALARGERCATVEAKINYFRPVRGGTLQCRSRIVNRGRTLASLEAVLSVDDNAVATAHATFAIIAADGAAPGG